jgi:hypothetical protein
MTPHKEVTLMQVLRTVASSVALLAVSLAAASALDPSSTPDYGTTNLTYVQVPGVAFAPQSSANVMAVLNNGLSGQTLRIVGGSGANYFSAPVQAPSGALLKSLEMNACDNTGSGGFVQLTLVASDALGNVSSASTTLSTPGTGCQTQVQDLTGLNLTVDNHTKHYWLVATMTNAGAGPIVGLAGAVVGYQLQVSPAPATATFLDVPTNHVFFQFIEALAASGITGGCGGGNYCPDSSVTRGQMAVFLAKALGLQFQ